MLEAGNEGVHRYYEQLIGQLNDMVYLIRGKLSKMARVTIGALAVIDVHARDVMKKVLLGQTTFAWFGMAAYEYDTVFRLLSKEGQGKQRSPFATRH